MKSTTNASLSADTNTNTITAPERNASASLTLVVLATLLGLAVRAYHLDAPKPWLDELTTLLYTTESWSRINELVLLDIHPPYYYLLQKFWNGLVGDSRFAARMLSVLLGTICIPLLYVLAHRLIGRYAGIISAWLLATAPLHVQFSRELRMYPLLCASVLVALIGLTYSMPNNSQESCRKKRLGPWIAYVLGSISAFYAHNTAIVLPALAGAWVLLTLAGGHLPRRWMIEFTVATAAIALAVAPWFAITMHHINTELTTGWWMPAPSWSWARSQFLGMFPYAPWLKLIMFALGLAGFVLLLRTARTSAAFAGTFIVGQPLLMWAISLYRPVLIVRALVWPAMLFSILPAAALANLRPKVAALATAMLVALQVYALKPYYPSYQHSDSEGLVAPLRAFNKETDILVLFDLYAEKELRREAPALFAGSKSLAMTYADRTIHVEPLHKSQHIRRSKIAASVTGAKRAWIVEELESKVSIKPQDDVRPALNNLKQMGQIKNTWMSGNLRLTLLEFSNEVSK